MPPRNTGQTQCRPVRRKEFVGILEMTRIADGRGESPPSSPHCSALRLNSVALLRIALHFVRQCSTPAEGRALIPSIRNSHPSSLSLDVLPCSLDLLRAASPTGRALRASPEFQLRFAQPTVAEDCVLSSGLQPTASMPPPLDSRGAWRRAGRRIPEAEG